MPTQTVFKLLTPLLALLLVALLAAPAFAHKAHVHGIAKLDVAIDGEQVRLRLESPLYDLIGFERAPRNERERAAVRDMASKLRQGERLFVPTGAARCRLVEVVLASPVLEPALLGEAGAAAPAAPRPPSPEQKQDHDEGHADLVAQYRFQCERPGVLTGMEVRLSEQFKGIRRVDAQVVAPGKQSAARLTSRSRALSW